jgi:hypothetical protein
MEGDSPGKGHVDRVALEGAIEAAFTARGFTKKVAKTDGLPLASLYYGCGMVWGISIVSSFDELDSTWLKQPETVSKVAEFLSRMSRPNERWNLTMLVVVTEPLSAEAIPLISRFQEDPEFFARFVVALGPSNPGPEVEKYISTILLQWMDEGGTDTPGFREAKEDLANTVREVGAELGVAALKHLSNATAEPDPSAESLVAAILKDVEERVTHED